MTALSHETSYAPIPLDLYAGDEWPSHPLLPVAPESDPLVPIGPHAPAPYHLLLTDPIYAGPFDSSPYAPDGVPGSLLTVFLRRSTADRLLRAQAMLPGELRLVVFDGYRPYETQEALYLQYSEALRSVAKQAGRILTEEELAVETVKYVKRPSTDPSAPAPHNTGGAVDLAACFLPADAHQRVRNLEATVARLWDAGAEQAEVEALENERLLLIKQSVRMLDYGSPYDDGGPAAALTYLERLEAGSDLPSHLHGGLRNRRQLHALMADVGMGHYVYEWWHFNAPETQLGALCLGLPHGTFGPMVLTPEQQAYERAARDRWTRLLLQHPTARFTSMQPAARISPPADLF